MQSKTKAQKKKLIQWINSIEDEDLLSLLSSIRKSSKHDESNWWENLSKDEKTQINKGLKDLDVDESVSSS